VSIPINNLSTFIVLWGIDPTATVIVAIFNITSGINAWRVGIIFFFGASCRTDYQTK